MGCDFVVANTDRQALTSSKAERLIQMGVAVTEGLGAGSQPEVGRAAAEEAIDEIVDHLTGSHMVFVTAGMGGGTGTGRRRSSRAPRASRASSPSASSPSRSSSKASGACASPTPASRNCEQCVDTLIVIPNQNLFRIANEKTTFADAFAMADQVLYSGVACITDLMVKEGLINLDFADVRSVMREMGKAMMGTGEASGERRATAGGRSGDRQPAARRMSMKGAKGLLISITGGKDLTLFEVDEAATRIREEVDPDANIILGATFEEALEGVIRVSVVATGIETAVDARESGAGRERRARTQERASVRQPARRRCRRRAGSRGSAARRAAAAHPAGSRAPAPQPTRDRSRAGITVAPLDPGPMNYGAPRSTPEHQAAAGDRRSWPRTVHSAAAGSADRASRGSRISRRSSSARSKRAARRGPSTRIAGR